MSHVVFSKVGKRFDKVVALADLDLSIEEGEFVSLLGPSGSGKTTTLNLLAGLLPIEEGEIRIGGTVVNGLSPDKRDIAMVFQNYALYPHMTVYENLAFPLEAPGRRRPAAEIEKKIGEVSALLGVHELLARYPKELSGGQQQRVALGRAMVRDPKVFLLDEPLSNLDARLRIRMRHDLKALHERIRSTIVYVTHDQAEAMSLSSRIAVFSQGRLQQYAPPAEIYNRPVNMFVANFVGDREINFIEGRLAGSRFEAEGVIVELRSEAGDRPATLGLRAEAIVPIPAGIGGAGIPATVTQVELAGPDLIVYAQVAGRELCCRADPTAPIAKGDPVRLAIRAEQAHLFDPATTNRLA